jgi:hypothetical protein
MDERMAAYRCAAVAMPIGSRIRLVNLEIWP